MLKKNDTMRHGEQRTFANTYADFLRLKRLLYDSISGLPSLPVVMSSLKEHLESFKNIGVISLNIQGVSFIEIQYGWQAYDSVLMEISQKLKDMIGTILKGDIVLAVDHVRSDDFMIFCLSQPNDKTITLEYMNKTNSVLLKYIKEDFEKNTPEDSIFRQLLVSSGFSVVSNNRLARSERLIYHGVNEAKRMANLSETQERARQTDTLRKIIQNKQIRTLFQPIIYMDSLKIMAYEALSVGPPDSGFENTEMLFTLAEEVGLGLKLDRICRESAIVSATELDEKLKLFMNVEPSAIDDPEFRQAQFVQFMKSYGLEPSKVVLEITERTAIKDYDIFLKSLNYFQNIGFRIAVDDAGAGYASLNSIAHLRPKFLKFDKALVKDIYRTPIKKQLLETLLDFSYKIGSHVIAEGIESEEDFQVLREMQVEFGQGYYIARPAMPFPTIQIKIN